MRVDANNTNKLTIRNNPNKARQENQVNNTPEMIGPTAKAEPITNPAMPITAPRLACGVIAALAVASFVPEFAGVFAEPVRVWTLLGGAIAICAIGVLDDLVDLDWMLKLGAQMQSAVPIAKVATTA